MNHPIRIAALGLWPLVAAIQGNAQDPASLRTTDTSLRFESTPQGPRLVELRTAAAEVWRNRASETLPDSVESDGKRLPVNWIFNQQASTADEHRVAYVYDCVSPNLRLIWEWIAHAEYGPIEHQIRIENRDSREIWIPFVDSIRLEWQIDPNSSLTHVFVEKGAGSPSEVGTHQTSIAKGYSWRGTSSTYAHPDEGEPREIIPWSFVERSGARQSAWYVGIEFSGRTRIALSRGESSLRADAGLNPDPAPFTSRIKPGESFETPAVFLGGATGGLDAAGNVLRRWVRQVLTNAEAWRDANYPLLVNNSWGSGMAIDEALAEKMLHDSADLQFEMFHIDAGWFRGVGDWYPDPKKFPHGLAPIADEAHRLGLKFGLWVDWTQAALDTEPGALNVRDPLVNNWVVADTPADWKPEPFKGQTIDLGVPKAQDWAQAESIGL